MDLGRGLCGLREMSHVCWVGFPCILGSLERVTNVLFWKCYTESLSSTHRIMRRVLRSHTVKKTVYPSVSQIDLTTGNDLFPSNTSQDVSIPQNRVGEKPQEIVWFFFFSHFYCCCSITKSCLTLCDLMDCNTPDFLSSTMSRNLLTFCTNRNNCRNL